MRARDVASSQADSPSATCALESAHPKAGVQAPRVRRVCPALRQSPSATLAQGCASPQAEVKPHVSPRDFSSIVIIIF